MSQITLSKQGILREISNQKKLRMMLYNTITLKYSGTPPYPTLGTYLLLFSMEIFKPK